jgi:signal transduction histidine kinase
MTWIVTAGAGYLPSLFEDVTRQAPFTSYLTGSIWLLSAGALVLLFVRRRTILDLWLMVALFATLPDLALSTLISSPRFTLGWYVARTYALIASTTVLALLLTETTVLYARLANAIKLSRRERAHRLMSLDAATGAMAHELRQPLATIALDAGEAALRLRAKPPELDGLDSILDSIEAQSVRADEIISSVRGLFKKKTDGRAMIDVEDIARQVLRLVQHDLQINDISVATEFQGDLPRVHADPTQMQQVILNLVKNAIEAMSTTSGGGRHLLLMTRGDGNSDVVMSVQDTGPGITLDNPERIFDPFVTTKAGGMGLGLAICRTIIEDHGGTLGLARTDSHGSIFEIALPIGSASGTP